MTDEQVDPPYQVFVPPAPAGPHLVEFLSSDNSIADVFAPHPGDVNDNGETAYQSTGLRSRGMQFAPTWQVLVGMAWQQGRKLYVVPVGLARHERWGAGRERLAHRHELVVAGPPGAEQRWISLTQPGIRYSDDEIDEAGDWTPMTGRQVAARLAGNDAD